MAKRLTTEDVKRNLYQSKHGKTHTFEKVVWVNSKTRIIVTCNKHKDVLVRYDTFMNSAHGCPKCGGHGLTVEEMIADEFEPVHGNRYDYSRLTHTKSTVKQEIGCLEHGWFKMSRESHKCGHGCPDCSVGSASLNARVDRFFAKAKDKFPTWDFSEFIYVDSSTPGIVICEQGHRTLVSPGNLLHQNKGCRKCLNVFNSQDEFQEFMAREHPTVDASEAVWVNTNVPIKLTCHNHAEPVTWTTNGGNVVLKGSGCPNCANHNSPSKAELSLLDAIKKVWPDAYGTDCQMIKPLHIDIVIPSMKVCVEYNGMHWHSEVIRDRMYHQHKTKAVHACGYHLIHVWESEEPDDETLISMVREISDVNLNGVAFEEPRLKVLGGNFRCWDDGLVIKS